MTKFGNPLTGTLWITNGYHMGIRNQAIDFSAVAEAPVYSMADGVVRGRNTGGGSWIRVDTSNSNIICWYTHVYKWTVNVGTTVKKGQLIGRIAPTSHNGGYPTHLHMGLSFANSSNYPRLFDYLDRRLSLNTRFASIANAWFTGLNFRWELHQNLSYLSNTNTMKVGNKVTFVADTNLRVGSGTTHSIKSKSPIKKGAVGTLIDGPRIANGYQWWDVKFLDDQGWVANVGGDRMSVTTRAVTNVNGTVPAPTPPPAPVDPCKAQNDTITKLRKDVADLQETQRESSKLIQSANDQIGVLQVQIKTLGSVNQKLEKDNANFKNIENNYLKEIEGLKEAEEVIKEQYSMAINEIGEMNETIAKLELKIKNLKGEMQKKDEQILNLKEKNSLDLNTLTLGDFIQWVG